jgi:hypothetical protein
MPLIPEAKHGQRPSRRHFRSWTFNHVHRQEEPKWSPAIPAELTGLQLNYLSARLPRAIKFGLYESATRASAIGSSVITTCDAPARDAVVLTGLFARFVILQLRVAGMRHQRDQVAVGSSVVTASASATPRGRGRYPPGITLDYEVTEAGAWAADPA